MDVQLECVGTPPSILSLGWRSNASEHASHDQRDAEQTDDDARRQQHHCDAHRQAHDDQHEPENDGDHMTEEMAHHRENVSEG